MKPFLDNSEKEINKITVGKHHGGWQANYPIIMQSFKGTLHGRLFNKSNIYGHEIWDDKKIVASGCHECCSIQKTLYGMLKYALLFNLKLTGNLE